MRFDAHTHFVSVADAVGAPGSPDPRLRAGVDRRRCRRWCSRSGRSRTRLERRRADDGRALAQLRIDPRTTVSTTARRPTPCAPLIELPRRRPRRFALALAIHPDEIGRPRPPWTRTAGGCSIPPRWPRRPTTTARFVQGSWAEFGLAKSGYVVADSGWFSDRSACYLAAGRPVVAQDTGFGRRLPVGAGLFAFAERRRRRSRRSRSCERTTSATAARRARSPRPPRLGPRARRRCSSGCCGERAAVGRELLDGAAPQRGQQALELVSAGPTATRPARRSRSSACDGDDGTEVGPDLQGPLPRAAARRRRAPPSRSSCTSRCASSRPTGGSWRRRGSGRGARGGRRADARALAADREGRRASSCGRWASSRSGRRSRGGSAGCTGASPAGWTSCTPRNPHLLDLSADWFRSWCERRRAALAGSDDDRAPELLAALDGYDERRRRARRAAAHLLHGELYPSNVLVVREDRTTARLSGRLGDGGDRPGRCSTSRRSPAAGRAPSAKRLAPPTATASGGAAARSAASSRGTGALPAAPRAPVDRLVRRLAAAARARPRLARRGARAHAPSWGSAMSPTAC